MKDCGTPPKPEEIRRYLIGFDFFERYVHGREEGEEYVKTHARRFGETLRLIPPLGSSARVLELGAVPYYFTILLQKCLRLHVDVASFYEFEKSSPAVHTVTNLEVQEQYEFNYQAVNVEKDIWPFEDSTFDLVLCCEILEHLLINPSHMLYEAHRVLQPGGYLLLTTPNVLRWQNVFALVRGQNIYDRYLGNGIYGRHNREYSPAEVKTLLERNGFEVEKMDVMNVYGSDVLNRLPLFANRRDNIFALARATGRARMCFPDNLYALVDEYRNVGRSSLTMGENEVGHLGRGWHGFEPGEPGFRWTTKDAEFFLKRIDSCGQIRLHIRSDHPKVSRDMITITMEVNGRELNAQRLTDDSWHDLTFEMAATEFEPVLQCRLNVSDTWIPKLETGTDDSRELGIAVSRIWLQ